MGLCDVICLGRLDSEQEIAFVVDDPRSVEVMKPGIEPAGLASRGYIDVLT
jgi:hypothetical protein